MIRAVRSVAGRHESGQTLILFAVIMAALMGTFGLAVEGGRVFVEYRKMQAAADMAALVGAQALPCRIADTSCQSTAATLACTYAGNNGFNGCTAQGSSGNFAHVPPVSCSPYYFVDYGNDSGDPTNGNSNCKSSPNTNLSGLSYIEVRLNDPLGTIPIFNVPVTLTTHAVARKSVAGGTDYTLIALNTFSCDITSESNSVNMAIAGSAYSQSSICPGNATLSACDGGWYQQGTGTVPGGISTNNTGTAGFSPPTCQGGSTDTTTQFYPGQPAITDPYANSIAPDATGSQLSTVCPQCTTYGRYINRNNDGAWLPSADPGSSGTDVNQQSHDVLELFPGIYRNIDMSSGGTLILNPGVYTITGRFRTNGGNVCVYGAPICDHLTGTIPGSTGDCVTTTFTPNTTAAGNWYYYCSTWGMYDTHAHPNEPSGLTTPPVYWNALTNSASSVQLNGVTLYAPTNGTSDRTIDLTGNGNIYPTFPNPCPGTGSQLATNVSFPAGAASGLYTYTVGDVPSFDTFITSLSNDPAGRYLYPSGDLMPDADCNNGLEAWKGEFTGTPQHLQFLVWSKDPNITFDIHGNANQAMWGIMYDPVGTFYARGSGGSSSGVPMLSGQIVAGRFNLNGTPDFAVTYRPCRAGRTCVSGQGTGLVE